MRKSIGLFLVVLFMVKINAQQIGSGLTTRITDFSGVLKTGAYEGISPTGGVPDSTHTFQHLFVLRHLNQNNNHQFQLGSTYTENDRMFFRKIAGDTIPKNTPWYEIATRGANNFIGNQTIDGNLTLNKELSFKHQRIDFTAAPRTVINPMSLKLWDNYNNGGPSQYGTVMEIYGYSGHQTSQLYFGGADSSRIRYREAFYNQNSWSDWVTLLDSKNDIESQGNLKITGNGNHYFLNGNVGIGTTSPTAGYKLDVAGKLKVNGDIWGSSILSFQDNARFKVLKSVIPTLNTDSFMMPQYGIAAPSVSGSAELWLSGNNGIKFFTNGNSNSKLSILSNGNVGIGTNSPSQLFDIEKDVDYQLRLGNGGGFGYNIGRNRTTGYLNFYGDQTGLNGYVFSGVNRTFMTITNNGNIGIGTTNPQTKLEVTGDLLVKNGDNSFRYNGTADVSLKCPSRGSGGRALVHENNNILTINYGYDFNGGTRIGNSVLFKDGGSSYINTGKVGIGTTNPDQMLTVKGKIHAEEVIIDLSVPAADYVFNSDYSLMPLHKVESYVKTNKHLPEIPSAAEVKEKGLSMGEMQNKLLQKIEELTLYVIEQQKKIEELENKIK